MTIQTWIDWCQKQLADMSIRLLRQGYHPARIEYLNQTSPEFREKYAAFLSGLNEVMDQMASNPDGYHHFDNFTRLKRELLEFTNLNRETFLDLQLARTA